MRLRDRLHGFVQRSGQVGISLGETMGTAWGRRELVEHGALELLFPGDTGIFPAGANIASANIAFSRDTYHFNFPGTPAMLLHAFRTYYGPTMNAFDAAEKNGESQALQQELKALLNSQNKSTVSGATSIAATYLQVTVQC